MNRLQIIVAGRRPIGLATALVAWALALAMVGGMVPSAEAAKSPRQAKAPKGDRFYNPSAKLIKRYRAGTPIWSRAAKGLARAPGAARTVAVAYRSTSIRHKRTVMTGTIALPEGKAPRGGWPVVTFGHVTTGAADSCAPSRVTADNPELERLTRGDSYVRLLLEAGIAVARPDFEGIGTPGPHPYLIGNSLGRAMTDIVRAGRHMKLGLGRKWAAAGHSEGGQAALFTAKVGPRRAKDLSFKGAAAFAPASHIREIMELARGLKEPSALTADFSALGALILEGAAVAEPSLWDEFKAGALSPEALALMPDTQKRCLVELAQADSFGAVAPGKLEGPRGDEILPRIYEVTDRNDPGTLRLPGVKVRLDQGASDLVVWKSHTTEVKNRLEAQGATVQMITWAGATHENVTQPEFAGKSSAKWLAGLLR